MEYAPPDGSKIAMDLFNAHVAAAAAGADGPNPWQHMLGPQREPRRLESNMAGSFERTTALSAAAEHALQTATALFDAHIAVAATRPIADLLPRKFHAAYAAAADGVFLLYLPVGEQGNCQVIAKYQPDVFTAPALVPFHLTDAAGKLFAAHVTMWPGCAARRVRLGDAEKRAQGFTGPGPVITTRVG